MIYGPERLSAQIRRAYLDGRPTELMIQQTNHRDYVGVWARDGRQFLFKSWGGNCRVGGNDLHVYDADSKHITHEVRSGSLPTWSRDGRTAVWKNEKTLRYFKQVEHLLP